MPRIEPFRGFRYDLDPPEAVADVIAPPYDVISEELQRTLHERHPYNFIRLEYGFDTPGEDRYARAAQLLNEWFSEGVLVEDERPAYYLYEQAFDLPPGVRVPFPKPLYRRRALFAAVGLERWGEGIHPHERTLAGPKKDRLRLLSTCRANLSPVFGIVSDADRAFETVLAEMATGFDPLVEFEDEEGHVHRFWRIDDPEAVARIRAASAGSTITVADGHHRYETALAYRDALKAQTTEWDRNHPANFVMMALVSGRSESLIILPIHRVVSGLEPRRLKTLPERLEDAFLVEEHPFIPAMERRVRDALVQRVQTSRETAYGLYLGGDAYWELRLREETEAMFADDAVSRLDVVRLHEVLFKRYLDIDTDDPTNQGQVTYTIRVDEATEAVEHGRAQLAVFVKPTTMEQIEAVARSGATMPQKSTYFFPKMPSGLVSRRV